MMRPLIQKTALMVVLMTFSAFAQPSELLKDPARLSTVRAFFNGIISSYVKTKTVPPEVRYFDPAQGRSDCEEQAVLWMDLIRNGKLFDDLDEKTQTYLVLRHLFIDKNNRDPFGMVVSGEDQAWVQTRPEERTLRRLISKEVDQRIMAQAQRLLPAEDLKDIIFTQTPVGSEGLTRISTLAGIKILLAYAKKHDIPLILKIKRMIARKEEGLRGQGETLIPLAYDQERGRFVVMKEIAEEEKAHPAFCIRIFSIINEENPRAISTDIKLDALLTQINAKNHKVPLLKTKEGLQKLLTLWDKLTKVKSFELYISCVKETNIEDLLWVLAARDDDDHKCDLLSSAFLSPYHPLKEILKDDERYTQMKEGKMVYTGAATTLAIRHVYVSTYAQQQESLKSLFQDIIANKQVTFDMDKGFEKINHLVKNSAPSP